MPVLSVYSRFNWFFKDNAYQQSFLIHSLLKNLHNYIVKEYSEDKWIDYILNTLEDTFLRSLK